MNNVSIQMTRRHPDLKKKVLNRDAKIAKKLIIAWDLHQDKQKVLDIFLSKKNNLSDYRYWELLRSVWIIAGGLENLSIFKELFNSKRKQKHYFSTPEESEYLRSLPEKFNVYRAANEKNDGGISWTFSKKYAFQYKETFNKNIVVGRRTLKKDVFAFINRNNESEIIIL